jgi:endo-1,4-beta-D-glucanase Y
MHRKARSLSLPLSLGLILSIPLIGCTQNGGTTGGGTGGKSATGGSNSGGSNSGGSNSGGSSAKGGSAAGGSSSGGSNSGGSNSGGSNSGGSASGGSNSGGSNSGGSNSGGSNSGGSNSGGSSAKGGSNSGGSNSGGSSSGGSSSGGSSSGGSSSGGSSAGGTAAGGTGAGGTGAGGSSPAGGSTAGADMISDFESTPGKADMDKNGSRTGYWYVYFPNSDTASTPASGMTISPALVAGAPIATEASDTGNALHVKGSGYNGASTNYVGFGAAFTPDTPYDKKSTAYNVSAYTGITFKMKSGSGTPPAVFFELLTKDNQPTTSGGSLNPDGTAGPDRSIGLYNTRGWMLNTPWQTTAISSSWQQITVPFGYLIPRHLTDSATCTSTASATALCQPPNFIPANVLGIQISMYMDNGWPSPSGSTAGTFDLWIDDVAFTKDDTGIETTPGFPLSAAMAGSMGSCKLPTGPSAYAKYLVPAYNQWKSTFVKNGKVIRPENQNDTVSEGIAYGMLIAANFNDKTTFDSLYGTWTAPANKTAGTLMTWCLGSGGGSTGTACATSGGSATDADEDAAFALLQADKIFGGGYKAAAMQMIKDIWASDIDGGTNGTLLPKGGSNYGSPSGAVTNPSYFAPAYYAAFKAAGDTNNWDGVISAVYKSINTSLAGTNSNGLYAAWCSGTCGAISKNNDATDVLYQYDSHRIPMRIGLDYCFNGKTDAKTYVAKTTSFFATNANAGKNGIGRIFDVYDPTTSNIPSSSVMASGNNAASIIGTAAVGAMADGSNTAFINEAYQAVFDLVTRGTLDTTVTTANAKTPYSYFNATVGLMTLLMMTGNFAH